MIKKNTRSLKGTNAEDVEFVQVSDIKNSSNDTDNNTNAILYRLAIEKKRENEILEKIRSVLNDLVCEVITFQEIFASYQRSRK